MIISKDYYGFNNYKQDWYIETLDDALERVIFLKEVALKIRETQPKIKNYRKKRNEK